MAGGMDRVVPAIQISVQASRRSTVRQAIRLSQSFPQLAVRLDPANAQACRIVETVLTAIDDPARLLVYLDVGQITQNGLPERIRDMTNGINELREVDDRPTIISMASSFPRSVQPYGEIRGSIPILERTLHDSIGGDDICAYGDHASIHAESYQQQAQGYVPRIDYALPSQWVYERHAPAKNGEGYEAAANELASRDEFEPDLGIWATNQITAMSAGHRERRKTPAFWIGVRVNMHLHRQIHYTEGTDLDDLLDEGFD